MHNNRQSLLCKSTAHNYSVTVRLWQEHQGPDFLWLCISTKTACRHFKLATKRHEQLFLWLAFAGGSSSEHKRKKKTTRLRGKSLWSEPFLFLTLQIAVMDHTESARNIVCFSVVLYRRSCTLGSQQLHAEPSCSYRSEDLLRKTSTEFVSALKRCLEKGAAVTFSMVYGSQELIVALLWSNRLLLLINLLFYHNMT